EGSLHKPQHLVRPANMKIRLHAWQRSGRIEGPAFWRRDVPTVAKTVSKSTPAITRRVIAGGPVDRGSAGVQCAVKGGVGVVHVQVNVCRRGRNLLVVLGGFDYSMADGPFRVHPLYSRHRT